MSDSGAQNSELGLDESLDALANTYRRELLLGFPSEGSEHGPNYDPLELVASVADRDTVRTELWHNHLPKLAAKGIIEWDEENGTVCKGPEWDSIRPLLTLLDDNRDELPADWH